MDYIELPFVKMSTNAVTPTRAPEGLVGYDFYSPANYIIPPCSQLLIPTEIKLGIPLGHWQTSLKIWLSHITSPTCGCRSYRSRLYGRSKGLINQYSPTCPLYYQGRPHSSINFGKSITSHTKESKGTFTHY